RVIGNENSDVATVGFVAQTAQPVESARHVSVKVELVAIIKANIRIGMPEHYRIIATKSIYPIFQERGERKLSLLVIVERFIAHHDESTRKTAAAPGKLRPVIKAGIVVQFLMRFVAPGSKVRTPVIPLRRVGRGRNNRCSYVILHSFC